MVKYYHCEKCKGIYNTETWIGEVHTYSGFCPSCLEGEQQENQIKQESAEDYVVNKYDSEQVEAIKEILDFAHREVGALADRYIMTLNRFNNSAQAE